MMTDEEMADKGRLAWSLIEKEPGYALKRKNQYWQMFQGHVSASSVLAYHQQTQRPDRAEE